MSQDKIYKIVYISLAYKFVGMLKKEQKVKVDKIIKHFRKYKCWKRENFVNWNNQDTSVWRQEWTEMLCTQTYDNQHIENKLLSILQITFYIIQMS